jgi:hypothetical protein
MSNDGARGVSDVVSFTLVFSTIILTIGVVTVGGVGTLDDVQDGIETNVAEETMLNYADSLSDHRTDSAQRRSSTIKLQGHTLELDKSASLAYEVDGNRNTPDTGALVRTTDTDARIVYQSGGLFRVQDGGSVVVRQPPFRCGSDTAHLAVTTIEPEGDGISISADGRVTLESELKSQTTTVENGISTVTVDAGSTPYTESWRRFLGGDWNSGSGDEYTCDVNRLVVHRTVVSLEVIN